MDNQTIFGSERIKLNKVINRSARFKQIVEALQNEEPPLTESYKVPAVLARSNELGNLWDVQGSLNPLVMVIALPKHARAHAKQLTHTSFTPVISYERGLDKPMMKLALTNDRMRLAIPVGQLTGPVIAAHPQELEFVLANGLVLMFIIDDTVWLANHLFWHPQWAYSLHAMRQLMCIPGEDVKAENDAMKEQLAAGEFEGSESILLPQNLQFETQLFAL